MDSPSQFLIKTILAAVTTVASLGVAVAACTATPPEKLDEAKAEASKSLSSVAATATETLTPLSTTKKSTSTALTTTPNVKPQKALPSETTPTSSSKKAPSSSSSPAKPPKASDDGTVRYRGVKVINTYPMNPDYFTQGLEYDGRTLLVGTGLKGHSAIMLTTLEDGKEIRRKDLDNEYFGEGTTRTGSTIWQLTWKNGVAFKRDARSLEVKGRANYEGEGWGLCTLDSTIAMSNGTSIISFRDPDSFEEKSSITVTLHGNPVERLNELECANGTIWANKWLTDEIYGINPKTGVVTDVVDASSLTPQSTGRTDVLNGIAHIPGTDRFLLTGKWWGVLYDVQFTDASEKTGKDE